ncbi:amino acid adenylation domain-containing protein [Amycolatopsis sp. VC5-11]|uniref:amino acid adenylation domain-containing protein n=1 Tax=Amycolatopsis sp. VC5-11 TaxID=3120156 RepID=UPI0030086CAC
MREIAVSSGQQQLWIADKINAVATAYNLPLLVRFPGGADERALRNALRRLAGRHPQLRTRYAETEAGLSATCADEPEIPLGHRRCDDGRNWEDLVLEATKEPFDLGIGPPARALLLHRGGDADLLCLVCHHIAVDGWSYRLLLRDFLAFYDHELTGEDTGLEPLETGYEDFAAGEKRRSETGELADDLAYWREKMAGFERLRLPADSSRRSASASPGAQVEIELSEETTSALKKLSLRTRSAFPNVIAALFQTLISIQSGQQDVTTGIVLNGRTDPRFRDVVGFFVNTVPLRSRIYTGLTFRELARAVHADVRDAVDRQRVPLGDLAAAAEADRSAAGNPLFDVVFLHHGEFESAEDAKSSTGAERQHWTNPVTRFDLEFRSMVVDGQLKVVLTYRSDLFERDTVERMAARFALLAVKATAEPDATIGRLGAATDEELAVLASWNDTAAPVPETDLWQLLQAQAERSPDAEAVAFGDERVSYADLLQRAAALATRLAEHGAGPGRIVAVALPRSVELVVALLAALRTGAAYLPLDVDLPDDRLRWMIDEAEPAALVAEPGFGDRLPGTAPIVSASGTAPVRPAVRVPGTAPAYVIYTSGSTGRPKGVVVHHEAIVNRLRWMQHKFELTPEDRVVQKTPASFDVSVWEFFWPLIQGATLVVAKPGGHRDPVYLAELIRTERISIAHFVPSMLRAFLAEPRSAECTSLRAVVCSGEALPPDLQNTYYETLQAPLFNLYGPTEAAVDVTSWDCRPGHPAVPIGRPVWNTRAYILDNDHNPRPIGTPGELYLAGTQIALGYLNRPDLTAERFLPDPWGPPGSRMYRTGDIARWDATGNLHYLGRADNQVKIRGQRIELDEITALLNEHPGVAHAATTIRETTPGNPQIVSYVVPAEPYLQRLAELDADLPRHRLPNGAVVTGRTQAEIDFLYEEIFENNEYLRHGIHLRPGDTVIDIGAHIGMFALFAHSQADDITIYAFEPVPQLHQELAVNTTLHNINARLFNHALGDQDTTTTFTYYPQLSILSGLHADETQDRASVHAYAHRYGDADPLVDDLITERLHDRHEITTRIRPLSDIIDEHHIAVIGLLKIDAEKSELEILHGIRPEHWKTIRQTVIEVHDINNRAHTITAQLRELGFTVTTETAATLTGSSLVNIYAAREPAPTAPRPVAFTTADDLAAALRDHLAAHLPRYMLPAHYVAIPRIPLSPNGKLHHAALPAPPDATVTRDNRPLTPQEHILADLFAAVLERPAIGLHDNFFQHGGHSLLAARLATAIHTTLDRPTTIADIFEYPTVSTLAAALDQERRPAELPPVTARPRPESVPLSFAQQRLWFLNQTQQGDPTYHLPTVLRLRGEVNRQALSAALDDVSRRHEVLRTAFPVVDGQPRQEVRHDGRIELAEVSAELSALQDMIDAAAGRPFDLSRELPLRATLFRLGPADHVLLLLVHHIASDGWSMAPLSRDLSTAYRARLAGNDPQWTPLPVQYADYAVWQRDLGEDSYARQLEYWRTALAGLPEDLPLPFDRPRPRTPTNRGASVDLALSAATHERVRELATQTGTSTYMVLQAALAVLLSRLGAGPDVPIGGITAGRTDVALADLVGFFVNTQVLRIDLSGAPTFREVLARVRSVDLAAFDHQDVPFDTVVELLNPPRLLSRHPLFQVMLTTRTQAEYEFVLPGLSVEPLRADVRTAKFDLTFGFIEQFADAGGSAGIEGKIEYATDLFDAGTVQRMARQLSSLLDRAVAEPDTAVGQLSVVTDEELAVLASWNDTAVPVPETGLWELLQAQAERSPDAEAIVFGEERVLYADLHQRAAALATRLAEHGAGPGRVVGIALPRSVDLVVALLAALRTGAAYLPLDVDLPDDRLRWMIDEADPAALVADPAFRHRFPGTAPIVAAPGDGAVVAPARPVRGDAPAYVIYTSGSTGRPKGVVVHHEAIVNRLQWMQRKFRLTPDDRVVQKTPASFDVSVWEFFWPLTQGATLVVAKPGGHRDPAYLAELIRTEEISIAHFVPSMLRAFVTEPRAADCTSLRAVVCSGEALPPDLQNTYYETLQAPLFNLYGPTEAAVDVTSWDCRPGHPTVPIGKPVWNTRAYVLDEHRDPRPIGVPGELYLAGTQIALGYLNRPDLTAERFLADPWGSPGDRMYRTGDIARWDATGNLHYLGRADNQVKIRGQRIELDEITALLNEHPGVADAATALRETTPGNPQIVSYVVPAEPYLRRLAELDADLPRHQLPNGAVMTGRTQAEIDFLYEEIFDNNEYLRHGIHLNPGDTVIDIGAHIGMFALFAHSQADDITIYAFEPIPQLHQELTVNTTLHNINAHLFNHALGSDNTTATFTYYPQLSILSGRHADEDQDRASVNAYAHRDPDAGPLVDDLITERLHDRHEITTRIRPLSDIIDEHHIAVIGLLKIDAEKSELEILHGIRPEHWKTIRQTVIEVHDINNRAHTITAMLEDRGFSVTRETPETLTGSTLVNLYATREPSASAQIPRAPQHPTPAGLAAALRDHLAARLPHYMLPAHHVVIPRIPLSPNGKLDRSALPAPHVAAARDPRPATPQEQALARLFAAVLERPAIGLHDNFFQHGGHSLLAARLATAIHTAFDRPVTIADVFQAPTVEQMSELLERNQLDDPFRVLLPLAPGRSGTPLFLLHPGIGIGWAYAGFAGHLPDLPLYAVQARSLSEASYTPGSLREMARDCLAQIRRVQPEGPYRLLGWSFGGNLAHETAVLLQESGAKVELLAIADGYPYAGEPGSDGWSARASEEWVERLRLGDGALQSMSREQLNRVSEVLMTNMRLAEAHEPARFRGDVVFFRAQGHRDVPARKPGAWQPFVAGELAVHDVPAGHHHLLDPEPLARIAAVLRDQLTSRQE